MLLGLAGGRARIGPGGLLVARGCCPGLVVRRLGGHLQLDATDAFEDAPGERARRGYAAYEGAAGAQAGLGDDTQGRGLRWPELSERKLRDERGTPLPPPPPAKEPLPSQSKEPRDAGL